MKLAGLLVLMLSWSAVATELSELQTQQLLEQKKYQTIISKIDDMAPYELVSHKVTALLKLEKVDEAMSLVEKRMYVIPVDNEWQAYNYYLKSQVHSVEAQDANIFTVKGYISDAIDSLYEAHKLQPNNLFINQALNGFLASLPSLFGGDAEEALVLAQHFEKSYPFEGGLLVVASYTGMEDNDKAEQKLKTLFDAYPQNHSVALQASHYYAEVEQFEKNQVLLERVNTWPQPTDKELIRSAYLINLEFAKNSIQLNKNLDNALVAIQQFKNAPFEIKQDYEYWPTLYEAQIRLLKGQKAQAVALAQQVLDASEIPPLKNKAERIVEDGEI